MRVVVLSQWFPPEKAAIPADIARDLAASGHEVTVLTGFPNYPLGKIYDGWRQRPWQDSHGHGFDVRRVALYPSHDSSPMRRAAGYLSFAATSSIFGWFQFRRAEVIYVYHPPLTAALGPWLSRRLGGAPYVLHIQDLWPDSVLHAGMIDPRGLGVTSRLLRKSCDEMYRRADSIVCIAPTMAAMLEQRGVPYEKLHTVSNWADEALFYPQPRSVEIARSLGFGGVFSVMFAGNMGELQGLDVAIHAAAKVQDLDGFTLVLVGDGVARESLGALAADLGAKNVLFLDTQPLAAINTITGAADVQLVCLRDLAFLRGTIPSKLGTLMASGLPVICAAAGDAARLVEDAACGWVCAPDDVQALADAFRIAYATSRADIAALASAGRRYYESHLARSIGVAEIESVLRAAVHVGDGQRSA